MVRQFEDLLVLILLGSAAISLLLGFLERRGSLLQILVEPGVILAILVANATVGVWQESSAAASIERLREFESKRATVVRDGRTSAIDAALLLPGDVLRLSVGDRVPADSRLGEICAVGGLMTDESMLTGESAAKEKSVRVVQRGSVVLQDMNNMLFAVNLLLIKNLNNKNRSIDNIW